jgi:hypothetical protein
MHSASGLGWTEDDNDVGSASVLVTTPSLSGSGLGAPPKFATVTVVQSSPFMFPFFVSLFSRTSEASSKEELARTSCRLLSLAVLACHYGSVSDPHNLQ